MAPSIKRCLTAEVALLFCFLSSLPLLPPSQISLLLTNTISWVRACAYPYDWRGFVRAKKKTSVGLSVFNSPMCFLLCYCKLVLASSRCSAPRGLFINYILFVDSLAVNKFHPPLKSCLVTLSFSSALFDYLRYSSPESIE